MIKEFPLESNDKSNYFAVVLNNYQQDTQKELARFVDKTLAIALAKGYERPEGCRDNLFIQVIASGYSWGQCILERYL